MASAPPSASAATIDATHDAKARSWVASANGHSEFPIQNLPFGVFSIGSDAPRGGIAIGDKVLDLAAAVRAGAFSGQALPAAEAASRAPLNDFLALGAAARRALRARLFAVLQEGAPEQNALASALHDASRCALYLPTQIGDYTDFFAGIHHATNAGRLFRPDNPLLANYKYVPVAYHGRSSSIQVSGQAVQRPNGQRKPANETVPTFGPSRNLDYELELGIWIGPGNAHGEPVPIAESADRIAGFSLLNDWSARDVQGWEYQPLGPFLAKNFCSSVSPWIVTPEALAPFRVAQAPRPNGDPAPLPYLLDAADQRNGALDLTLEVFLTTRAMREKGLAPHRLSIGNTTHLYWTFAQLVAHHTCGGCNLRPGDLFGSGTISTPTPEGFGSLLELTLGGRQPLTLASGESRRFLEDGDEVVFRAHARRDGFASIGFGECRAEILPARG